MDLTPWGILKLTHQLAAPDRRRSLISTSALVRLARGQSCSDADGNTWHRRVGEMPLITAVGRSLLTQQLETLRYKSYLIICTYKIISLLHIWKIDVWCRLAQPRIQFRASWLPSLSSLFVSFPRLLFQLLSSLKISFINRCIGMKCRSTPWCSYCKKLITYKRYKSQITLYVTSLVLYTSVNAQCDKMATTVGRTMLTTLATIDAPFPKSGV